MWRIVDWADNNVNTGGKIFETFEDGWEWIYANVPDEDDAYDDLFVEKVKNEQG